MGQEWVVILFDTRLPDMILIVLYEHPTGENWIYKNPLIITTYNKI